MENILHLGRKFLTSFTAVFTCTILASSIYIGIYSNPFLPFRLIVQALIIAVVSALLNFIYYSEKPIHQRGMVLRTLLHFSLLFSMILFCAWYFEWFSFSYTKGLVTFILLFLAVYGVIWIANFTGDIMDERRINKRLKELNEGAA